MKKLLWSFALVLLLPLAAAADERTLLVVSETIQVNKKPEDVWKFLKRFDGLKDWHPIIAKSDIIKGKNGEVGAVRQLTVKDNGPTFTETLIAYNEQNMSFSYDFLETPFHIVDYISILGVRAAADGGTTVSWSGTFRRKSPAPNPPKGEDDAAALEFITGAYQSGLANLKKVLEK